MLMHANGFCDTECRAVRILEQPHCRSFLENRHPAQTCMKSASARASLVSMEIR
jgi:hypothetical protein